MNLKFFKSFAIATAVLLSVATSAQAQYQTLTLAAQVAISPTKTVDIDSAREVSTVAGNNYVIDRNGVKHTGVFANVSVVYGSPAFQNYVQVSNGVWRNLTQTTAVECTQGGSVTTWANGTSETVNDGCAFASAVYYRARRI